MTGPGPTPLPDRARLLRRIRRFAVPRPMIEWATERRLAGDWRGACDAARVDTVFDLARLPRWYGKEFMDALEEELHHLVPDLLRWHFPRAPGGTLPDGDALVVLGRPEGGGGPWLTVRARESRWLELDLLGDDVVRPRGGPRRPAALWTASRYLWDDRYVHETRERWGGGPDRAPFLNPDGTPRTAAELPTADPGPGDPAARTEWTDHLYRSGRTREALAAAGIVPDPERGRSDVPPLPGQDGSLPPPAPSRWRREVRSLAASGYGPVHPVLLPGWSALLEETGSELLLSPGRGGPDRALPLPEAAWAVPPDIEAVLAGVSPDHLHPLVREALAPARPSADGPVGPPGPEPPGPARVLCGGEWHLVEFSGGRLRVREEEQRRREDALVALGGPRSGCTGAEEAWTGGLEAPPGDLERIREDLFERARQGDTEGVLHHLDRGGDARVRARTGETLLHHLAALGHEVLLRRLLAGGLHIDTRDGKGRTALFVAAHHGGGVPLLRVLHRAGAGHRDIGERALSMPIGDSLPALVLRRARRQARDGAEWDDLGAEMFGPGWKDRIRRGEWPTGDGARP